MWLYFWPSDHFVERGFQPSLLPAHTSGGVWPVSAALEIRPAPSCESPHPMLYPEAELISQTYLHTLARGRVQMPTPSCGWETTGNDERCLNLKGSLQMWGCTSQWLQWRPPCMRKSSHPCRTTPVIAKANVFRKWFGRLLGLEMDCQTSHHTSDLNSFPKTLVFSTQQPHQSVHKALKGCG